MRSLEPLFALVLALPAAAQNPQSVPAQPGTQAPEDDELQHTFAIPETRLAKARLANAEEHLAAARWSEAIEELQRLIEEHRGEMLAGERQLPGRARSSDQPVHAGASQRAREMLFALPAEARALYQARFAAPAGAALAHAREHRDRRELAEVGRRWPATAEAELAWWSLGDLELEEGRALEARLCWSRAIAVRELRPELELVTPEDWNSAAQRLDSGDARAKSAAARARAAALFAADTRAQAARTEEEALGSLQSGVVGRTNGQGPGRGASSWTQPWRLADSLPREFPTPRLDAFFLARSGDLLFVNPPLHVVALNAWTGLPVWESEEPEGWKTLRPDQRPDLFMGIDQEGALYAPAANARVVVGVLQLPFSLSEVRYFSNIKITVPNPQRRLFAFDARTGKPLWDHRPPRGWDGGPAPFEQRMIVAGPPVISGDRVLAPLYVSEGRIDYHVGCFDVDTGELLWARALISGQRELNMFGRPPHEFSAPPLVVSGSRVFALTQLGTVACLDLFSGDVLWQTRYEQIPIPKNQQMEASQMKNVWRPSAPVVSGRTLIATPFDSHDMIGLDVATGAQVWSLPNVFFAQQGATKYAELLFLGAGERSVYVMGQSILGVSSRAGLEREAPTSRDFLFSDPDLQRNLGALGRPLIAGTHLVVPLLKERVDLELPSGREQQRVAWNAGLSSGNLLVGKGELFTISRTSVEGYFEWQQMVERARADHERTPSDPHATELYAQLLGSAADNALADGKSEAARSAIEEARKTLEDFERAGGSLPPALGALLHRTLRLEARVRLSLADGERARAALELARARAPTLEDLQATLFEELALAPARSAARTQILALLEERVPGLPLECVQPPLVENREPQALEWIPAALAPAGNDAETHRVELTVGLWVLLERASSARAAHAPAAELESLGTVLSDYADVALPSGTTGVLARARIAELFAGSAKELLEPFEQRAAAALALARGHSDRAALARIPELYPCTRAAGEANDARIELALSANAPGELLGILSGELTGEWHLARAGRRELELLARAGLSFERAGNVELAAELLRTLAAARPDYKPAAAEAGGRDLATLGGARARWQPPESAPPIGSFKPDAPRLWTLEGRYQILGRTQPADLEAERLQLVAGTDPAQGGCELRAFASTNLEQPLWTADVSGMTDTGRLEPGIWRARSAVARGRVLLCDLSGVLALDERTGTRAWQWAAESPTLECTSLCAVSGIVLVALRQNEDAHTSSDWLQALDAQSGAALWRIASPGTGVRALPLASSNTLVFLPPTFSKEVVLHDLFTGARTGSFTLEQGAPAKLEEDAWIEGDRLILPWIDNPKRAQIECWDLALRRRSWRIDLNEGSSEPRVLAAVLQSGTRTWLYQRPTSSGSESNPSLCELSTGIGALSPLSNVRLALKDRLLGPSAQKRRRLPSSEIFVLSERPQAKEETRVRCIDLASGERWSASLRAPFAEIGQQTPAPALSADGVVLAYTPFARSDRANTIGSNVVFLDRANGLVRADKRALSQEAFGRSDALEFVPLGDGLMLRGQDRLEVWR